MTCIRLDLLIADLKKLLSMCRSSIYIVENLHCLFFFFFLILTNCHHTEQKLKLRVPIVKISLSVSYKYLEMSFFLIVVVVFWPFYNFLLNATSTTICLPVFRQSSFYLISVLQHCIFPSDTVNVFYYLTILCPFTCKLPFISKILILKITNKPMVYA